MSDTTEHIKTKNTAEEPESMAMDGMMTRENLLQHLDEDSQVLKNVLVKQAFEAVDRKDFVAADYQFEAYEDYPLPTSGGQTMLQPTTMAFMLELLEAKPDHNVLNIGSGSGWSSALLGHIVGENGNVAGLEIVSSLVDQSKKHLKKYKDLPVTIHQATKEAGLFKKGPFDRILSTAAFQAKDDQTVLELLLQLIQGGVMVVPVGETIVKFEKVDEDNYYETEYSGFSFSDYV